MLPLGLSIWPEKRVVSKEDKVTTMGTECSFATKNNATRYKYFLHFIQISLVWSYLHSMSYKLFLSGIFYPRAKLFYCKVTFYALLSITSVVHWIICWGIIVLRFELIRAKLYCFSDKKHSSTTYHNDKLLYRKIVSFNKCLQ